MAKRRCVNSIPANPQTNFSWMDGCISLDLHLFSLTQHNSWIVIKNLRVWRHKATLRHQWRHNSWRRLFPHHLTNQIWITTRTKKGATAPDRPPKRPEIIISYNIHETRQLEIVSSTQNNHEDYYIFIFIQGHPYRPIGLLTGYPNQVHIWMPRSWSDVALRISGGAEFHLTAAKYDSECKPKRRETLGRTRPLDTCERVRRAVRKIWSKWTK